MSDIVERLMACPFCGSTNISAGEVLGEHKDGTLFKQTGCSDCGALGPMVELVDIYDEIGCNAAWNNQSLRQQLDSFQESTKSDWERIRTLQGKLEAYEMASAIVSSVDSISIVADLRQQLAECQARQGKPQSAAVVCLLTTELDTLKKQWQREALLEAADWFDEVEGYLETGKDNAAALQLRRMAKELE